MNKSLHTNSMTLDGLNNCLRKVLFIESQHESTQPLPTTKSLEVSIRIRPPYVNKIKAKRSADNLNVVHAEGTKTVLLTNGSDCRRFEFSNVFAHTTTQEQVYRKLGLRQVAIDALNGYDACIMAYGQTGSGKTYTMMGISGQVPTLTKEWMHIFPFPLEISEMVIQYLTDSDLPNISKQGLIPRFCHDLFNQPIEENSISVSAVFTEIYNEEQIELSSSPNVNSVDDIMKILKIGTQKRITRSTKMNDHSSRSHAVFSLTVSRRTGTSIKRSLVDLVDLAGSERVGQNAEEQLEMTEGCNINLSLLVLGRVVNALAERSQILKRVEREKKKQIEERKKQKEVERELNGVTSGNIKVKTKTKSKAPKYYIPFCDSTLTRLLQKTLGTNARSYLIANVSPETSHIEETLSTLRYAENCSRIQTSTKSNTESPSNVAAGLMGTIVGIYRELDSANYTLRSRKAELDRLNDRLEEHNRAAVFEVLEDKKKSKMEEIRALESFIIKHEILLTNYRERLKELTLNLSITDDSQELKQTLMQALRWIM
eukprot:NODE_1750_length_1825_cov_18.529965_g1484_i0.p1 GENE.NODE_1750_length_1825_cov_18.529965_g1484_i0~~NODE_1750_length_1825_cov_18.529965_g1484_i0.p1  ORF type:complete len:542 (-),score=76.44 NODE_1750_length_1825_cov_18.529965_g1484_i0:136-1761(-)